MDNRGHQEEGNGSPSQWSFVMDGIKRIFFVFFVTLIGTCLGCSSKAPKVDNPKEKKEEAIPVEVVTLHRGRIQASIHGTANLIAEVNVTVIARTSNRVKTLLVEEGDIVEAGQLLLQLEDYEQGLQLERAQTQLAKLQAQLERTKPLYEQKLVSKQEYDNLVFEVRSAQVAVEEAQRNLDYTRVTAPISGVITRRYVNVGDFVSTGQRLFEIVDLNSLAAPVYVPDKYLAQLKVGQRALVRPTALPGQEFEGYVKRIAPIVEAQTGTVKVTIGFHSPGPLRPGMYATVEIITQVKTNALLIPKRALVYYEDQLYVYRVRKDLTVERVPVHVALEDQNFVEPTGGFQEGDQIVVAGQTGLKQGVKVRIVQPKPMIAAVATNSLPTEAVHSTASSPTNLTASSTTNTLAQATNSPPTTPDQPR